MPSLGQWLIGGAAIAAGGYYLASAFWFRHWAMKWHNRMKPADKQTPMSMAGRIAMGAGVIYWGLGMLLMHLATKVTEVVWVIGFFMLLLAVVIVQWRDKRNNKNVWEL